MSITDELNLYHKDQSEFHRAVYEVLGDVIDDESCEDKEDCYLFFKRLIEPDRLIRFRVEWYDDNNCLNINRGFRIQYHNALGPYKGGLRFDPSVNESILKFLGFEQIFKCSLTGLPMGGAKGGSDFSPKGKSENEVMRFCQAFMSELHRHIGENIDIPAGDIGVGEREIGYLYGHYLNLTNKYTGVLTGKHPNFGGSCGREEATGHGAVYLLEKALNHHDQELKGKKTLISGAGNVALHVAEKLIAQGAKVQTLSDRGGTLYFKEGLSAEGLKRLKDHKIENRRALKSYRNTDSEYYNDKSPWNIEADLAIPCATQNEMSGKDVKQLLKNGVIAVCEGANMPLDQSAMEVIRESEALYLPGKAANAGGVAISGIERTQNANHMSLDYDEVDKKLQQIMNDIHARCLKFAKKRNGYFDYKKGANIFAYKKLRETTRALWG